MVPAGLRARVVGLVTRRRALALLDRGDVLDADALLTRSGSQQAIDVAALRQLRKELADRGYLDRALAVARAVEDRGGPDGDRRARRRAFLAGLVGGRLADAGILAPAAARWLTDTVRESYLTATDHLDGYPDVITASQLLTRTTRAIAACPTWLLGPEVPVEVPFLHPDVLTAALRIPAKRKEGGRFYRELLEQVCGPRVASLPSTRDPLRPVVPVVRRQTGAAALAALAGPVSSDPVMRPLVGPRLAAGLADPAELHRLVGRSGAALAFLQWADLLVYWRRRHSDRLVWPEGGWPS